MYLLSGIPSVNEEKGKVTGTASTAAKVKLKDNVLTLTYKKSAEGSVYVSYITKKQVYLYKIADIAADGTVTVDTGTDFINKK